MANLEIYEKVRNVPSEAKKAIGGGRLKGMTDINPMWRIKTLTELFGPCGIGWYYDVTRQWTEEADGKICAFVDINLFILYEKEWSKPIFGTGGSMLLTKESGGSHVSDECYKMALTDALSVACKQLGIGADVYWDKDKTKYNSPFDRKILQLQNELKRTGFGMNAIRKTYAVDSIGEMSEAQIDEFLTKIKGVPDKKETA